ncbi:unnamed protein product [Linum trigynum]|uniref:Uncharacterized protein n=1 Tax=Linum trigynum TaxID=586398 RepID=A0AAV2G6W0_9ROSI
MNFRTAEKQDSFANLLRSHGFSGTQIAKCIKRCPGVLGMDPERIVGPKLDFLRSIGISEAELVEGTATGRNGIGCASFRRRWRFRQSKCCRRFNRWSGISGRSKLRLEVSMEG